MADEVKEKLISFRNPVHPRVIGCHSTKEGTGWTRLGTPHVDMYFSGGHQFNCCGAAIFHGLYGEFVSEKQRQSFAAVLYNLIRTSRLTRYGIASSDQLPKNVGKMGVVQLLMDLGAVEVDHRPNLNHGPNWMYMLVLSPNEMEKNWDKFTVAGPYNSRYPKWFLDLSVAEQQALDVQFGEEQHKDFELARRNEEIKKHTHWKDKLNSFRGLMTYIHHPNVYYRNMVPAQVVTETEQYLAQLGVPQNENANRTVAGTNQSVSPSVPQQGFQYGSWSSNKA